MKAITQDKYGSAEVLEFRDLPVPSPAEHEVLVRVVAAGVDLGAWHFMTGQPYLMRIIGFGLRAPRSRVPGTNFAGRVEALGSQVTAFNVGDEVYGTTQGAYAELTSAKDDKIALKPAELTFEEAAVLPYAGFAALQALREHGKLQQGQRVLIVGASGAVGSVAVQIANALGARVTGVCSSTNAAFVTELGATEVIDYEAHDFSSTGEPYDLILDIGGSSSVAKLRRPLNPRGRLVIVGGGGRWTGIGRQVWATALSTFVSQHLGTFVVKEHRSYLEELNGFVTAGKLRPPRLARTFPLVETPGAVRLLEEGHQTGRIAITV